MSERKDGEIDGRTDDRIGDRIDARFDESTEGERKPSRNRLERLRRFGTTALWLALPAIFVGFAAASPHTWAKNTAGTLTCAATLVGFAAARRLRGRLVVPLVVGLLFSVVGDRLMSVRGGDERLFLGGIGAFFLAHLSFLTGFWSRRVSVRRFAAFAVPALVATSIYFAARVFPAVPSPALRLATTAYLAVSIASLAGAFALDFRPAARAVAFAGIASIVFSDVLIAESVFADERRLAFLIIPTYVATHLLITASVLLEGSAAPPTGADR